MKRYLLAAWLAGILAAPASAATYYVMFDKTKKQCSIATTAPTETEKFSMMGQFGSRGGSQKGHVRNERM